MFVIELVHIQCSKLFKWLECTVLYIVVCTLKNPWSLSVKVLQTPDSKYQQTWNIHPMSVHCWPTVCDAGPTLYWHWVNVSCLLGLCFPLSWYCNDAQKNMWGHSHSLTYDPSTAMSFTDFLCSPHTHIHRPLHPVSTKHLYTIFTMLDQPFDVGPTLFINAIQLLGLDICPTLYECHTNILCFTGWRFSVPRSHTYSQTSLHMLFSPLSYTHSQMPSTFHRDVKRLCRVAMSTAHVGFHGNSFVLSVNDRDGVTIVSMVTTRGDDGVMPGRVHTGDGLAFSATQREVIDLYYLFIDAVFTAYWLWIPNPMAIILQWAALRSKTTNRICKIWCARLHCPP